MHFRTAVAAVLSLFAWVCSAAGLHVEVLRGNSAINRPGQLAASVSVRVLDDAGKPVPRVAVYFSSPAEGSSVDFGGAGNGAQAQTDESGFAGAPSMRATGGNGPVELVVLAEKDGVFANGWVHQMNVGFGPPPPTSDLEITRADAVLPVAKGERVLRLRVQNEAGVPVPKARLFTQAVVKSKPTTLVTEANADGIAEFHLDAKSLDGRESLLVRAEANGLNASRFVPLN